MVLALCLLSTLILGFVWVVSHEVRCMRIIVRVQQRQIKELQEKLGIKGEDYE